MFTIGLFQEQLIKSLNMFPKNNLTDTIKNIRILSGSNEMILAHINKVDPSNPYLQVVDYIKRNTNPKDRILAIPFLTSLYYFSERPFGAAQMFLAPGYFFTEKDQQK